MSDSGKELWINSKMESFYPSADLIEIDCAVRISQHEIMVEYDDEGQLKQYRGFKGHDGNFEIGHFCLTMKSATSEGTATLHRFADSSVLEGYWVEDGYRGMWRIKLG